MAERYGPPSMDWTHDSSLYSRYQDWQWNMENYLRSHYKKEEESRAVYCLMNVLDDKSDPRRSMNLIKRWTNEKLMDSETQWELKTWWKLLDATLISMKKTCEGQAARELFLDFQQGNLSLVDWHTKLKNQISTCGYPEKFQEMLLRDMLAGGCRNFRARRKIYKQWTNKDGKTISVKDIVDIIQEYEEEEIDEKEGKAEGTVKEVHYVRYDARKKKPKVKSSMTAQPEKSKKQCFRCGAPWQKDHIKDCKASKATCNNCKKVGHFAKCCKSTKKIHVQMATEVSPQFSLYSEEGSEYADMHVVTTGEDKDMHLTFQCALEEEGVKYKTINDLQLDRPVTLKIDTGADVNTINIRTYKKLFPDVQLKPSAIIMTGFEGGSIRAIGQFNLFVSWKGKAWCLPFHVSPIISPDVLSRKAVLMMKLMVPQFTVTCTNPQPNADVPIHAHKHQNPHQNAEVPIRTCTTADSATTDVFSKHVETVDKSKQCAYGVNGEIVDTVDNTVKPSKATIDVNRRYVEAVENPKKIPIASIKVNRPYVEAVDNTENYSNAVNGDSVDTVDNELDPEILKNGKLTKEQVIKTYQDVFQGLGKLPGEPYKLKLKEGARPAMHRIRSVPVHLRESFDEEVKRLVELGVLEKMSDDTHSEWINSYVVVEKTATIDSSNAHAPGHKVKKKIRLCLDPRDLNEALEREPYYSRSIDELIAKFEDAVVFTIVDCDKGYWQVLLHPDSWKYTCMALPDGRYVWKRLPMGSTVASDVFQRKLDQVYHGLPGVTGIADDMVVYGRDDREHDENFNRFLKATRKNGVVLNKDKLQFKQRSVSFFGHTWSDKGISPDPKKLEAIQKMNFPTDKDTLHSFLGLVNYLGRYSKDLAVYQTDLRELLKKDVQYKPTEKHLDAFYSIKKVFRQNITLPYFSSKKSTVLQVDASKKGFGACLLQDDVPVYFASRALTPAEKRYENIERECMAAVWGMEKFHYYLYGGHFTLQTDQKPLVAIFKKHMIDVSPRIQRIAIRAWQYDFEPVWIPGKSNVVSDALSRVNPMEISARNVPLPVLAVHFISSSADEDQLTAIRVATTEDQEMQQLSHYISEGWPQQRKQLPANLHTYWNYRDELTQENGILYKSSKVLIPKSLRAEYIRRVHDGHQGIEKSTARAREYVFWPGYTNDIKEYVEKCRICQESLHVHNRVQYASEVPPHAWHTIGSDLFYWNKMDFLVLVDYFSKFPIVRKLPNSTSQAVIQECSKVFAELGKPFIFRSDNGPCYSSDEFKRFMHKSSIRHTTSSPHYPQSNGLAESMVKVSKNLMKKAIAEGKEWYEGLLDYRTTPQHPTLPSPAEIFYGRKIRSAITISHLQLMNKFSSENREKMVELDDKKVVIKKNVKEMEFESGQKVFHYDVLSKKWYQGEIVQMCKEPNSYLVKSVNGATYRRTRNHIKPCQIPDPETSHRSTVWKPAEDLKTSLKLHADNSIAADKVVLSKPAQQPILNAEPSKAIPIQSAKLRLADVPKAATPKRSSPRRSTRTNKGQEPLRLQYS